MHFIKWIMRYSSNIRAHLLAAVAAIVGLCFDGRVAAETHYIFDSENHTVRPMSDSPYAINQPHSLVDFLNQVSWFEELRDLRSIAKKQQQKIERRYDEDDPDIESKVRATDPNCVRAKPLDLQTENFVVTYAIDLVPNFVYDLRLNKELQVIASTRETLQIAAIEKLFLVQAHSGRIREPLCQNAVPGTKRVDEEADSMPNIAEPELANLSESDLKKLGSFLSDRLDDAKTQKLALYYSSFYWRLRGNSVNALKCLFRYMEMDPDSNPAMFQLGTIYIKFGEYQKAAKLLETVRSRVNRCGDCYLALGDAYVLDGNFPAAIRSFEEAFEADPDLEIAAKKTALLRCIMRIFEVMEGQHSTLLDTINDVERFKERMKRMRFLEAKIEKNRAPPEARLQSKLAFEHFEFGPVPYLNCRGGAQWISGRERSRLFCTVDNWTKLNESLSRRQQQLLKQHQTKISAAGEERSAVEEWHRATKAREAVQSAQFAEYLERIRPFVGLPLVEPQLPTKYPLRSASRRMVSRLSDHSWPSHDECRKALSEGKLSSSSEEEGIELPQAFLPPENKGFVTSTFLTKYLALGPGEMSPLPWHLPYCGSSGAIDGMPQRFEFIFKLDLVKSIKSDGLNASVIKTFTERKLRPILEALAVGTLGDADAGFQLQEPPPIGDIGQRIGNLLRFKIGPPWLALNLAALFFRFLGMAKEAVNCLELALVGQDPAHRDLALSQLAQILLRATAPTDRSGMASVERILSMAMTEAPVEPLPYYLLGTAYAIQNRWAMAERHLWQSLELDPEFGPPLETLLARKCTRRMAHRPESVRQKFSPVCCWPNEQNIHCFERTVKKGRRRKKAKVDCFRLEAAHPELPHSQTNFVYFRCNTPYTARSYRPPAFAQIIVPLLQPAAELRQLRRQRLIDELTRQQQQSEGAQQNQMAADEPNTFSAQPPPVFPLDYGGYSEERILEHQQPIWPSDFHLYKQLAVEWHGTDEDLQRASTVTPTTESVKADQQGHSDSSAEEERQQSKEQKAASAAVKQKEKAPLVDGKTIAGLASRADVVKYDISLPEKMPEPSEHLVARGKQLSQVPSKNTAQEYKETCQSHKKSQQLLEQPVSTYVSVTAKGIVIEDLVDIYSPVTGISRLEPVCPEASKSSSTTDDYQDQSLLDELDQLPAYLFRENLQKFYRPEKALRDTLHTLGGHENERAEHIAARLYLAMHASNQHGVHWALSTLSALYWRVKGDAVNAIRCLRHSLHNSPSQFKDVPLISLANIFHQAGFLHSALVVGGRALEISRDSVVATHFTLANIFSSMGDYRHALQFYYSTAALQANFQPTKDRIRAIHCLTDGRYLDN